MSGDKYGLFWQAVHYNENGIETRGERKFLYKSIEIEFHGRSRIESCWRDLYSLWCCDLDLIQVTQDL